MDPARPDSKEKFPLGVETKLDGGLRTAKTRMHR